MRAKCPWVVILASLAASGPVVGGGGKEAAENELKKLQGTWQFISQEVGGKPVPPAHLAKMTITFTADKWAVREDGKVVQAGSHKLDPTKKPAQVDAIVTEGPDKGSTMLGIYELKGDTMKVCFDPAGKERPTSFTAQAGQMAVIIQRDKKKP
jgi:uncharacterized protein (TIGR03067 family)